MSAAWDDCIGYVYAKTMQILVRRKLHGYKHVRNLPEFPYRKGVLRDLLAWQKVRGIN